MIRRIYFSRNFWLVLLLFLSCHQPKAVPDESTAAIHGWQNCFLELNRSTEGYRPPVSARFWAYSGIAAWECARAELPNAVSLSTVIKGVPTEEWSGGDLVLPAALNALYAALSKDFFPEASTDIKKQCERYEQQIKADLLKKYSYEAVNASEAFGRAIEKKIFEWSATDSIGHAAYLYNYDRTYSPPEGIDNWEPEDNQATPALLPHWGQVRTFVTPVNLVKEEPPVPYSSDPGSACFAEAMEVFAVSQALSEEERWVAEFWSDDFPGVTFSAPCRWIAIAQEALVQKNAGLEQVLEVYLKTALAMHDATVIAWSLKYKYNRLRPETYIRRHIDSQWRAFHPAPPFPAYPSGHASFGSAASEVLAHIFGDNIVLTDRTHIDRKEFNGSPRTYHSFSEMGLENAMSRILMGVHFRMDMEEGLRLGKMVGSRASTLPIWAIRQ